MSISTAINTYLADFQTLLYAVCTDVVATNKPKRQACYIITNKKNIPLGYIEAKYIGKSLDSYDIFKKIIKE